MRSTFEQLFHLSRALLATLDSEGRFLDVNPAWERTLGWTADELRGARSVEFIHPDDLAATVASASRSFREGETAHVENRYRCKDGSYKWLMWSSYVEQGPEQRIIYASAVDVTEYKELLRQREEALEELHLLRTMLEQTPDQIGIVDVQGRVRYRNPAAKRHVGRDDLPEEPLDALKLHSPAFAERLEKEITPYLIREGTWSGEGDLLRADGTIMPTYQVLVALKDERGELTAFGTLIRDMTELKQMELQLRASLQALATPLIPISDRVLVMPLIGQMDLERAAQVTRAALEGVHGRAVEVVILDVTGLQHVDTQVAGLLLQTARSLRLLGVRTVLTGIQPLVAQALIGLGLDLSGVETASTLQSAISLAMRAGALPRSGA